jgi:hypothetical protein
MLPTIMYDTVKFVLPAKLVEGGITDVILESVALLLQDLKKTYNKNTGEVRLEGKLEGLDVSVSPTRLIVENSFQKFVTGDQLTPMTAEDVRRGIRMLTELFGLPMELAIISRLDVAINIPTERPPAAYYAFLGEATYYERKIKKNTLYYMQSNRKSFAFYDKMKEMEASAQKQGLPTPANLPNGHLLRMEFRILKQVKAQLNWSVTAATLYQPEFIRFMLDLLREKYNAIYKIRDFGGLENVKGVKDLKNYRSIDNIRQKGGLLGALKELEQVRPRADWDDQQYDRLRKETIKMAETPVLTSVSPLVEELDRKVQELTQ